MLSRQLTCLILLSTLNNDDSPESCIPMLFVCDGSKFEMLNFFGTRVMRTLIVWYPCQPNKYPRHSTFQTVNSRICTDLTLCANIGMIWSLTSPISLTNLLLSQGSPPESDSCICGTDLRSEIILCWAEACLARKERRIGLWFTLPALEVGLILIGSRVDFIYG